MKRTIEIHGFKIYYRGSYFSDILKEVQKYFKLGSSRIFEYVITIEEGTQFRIVPRFEGSVFYELEGERGLPELHICKNKFHELFFVPEAGKRYDITVKKVRKKK